MNSKLLRAQFKFPRFILVVSLLISLCLLSGALTQAQNYVEQFEVFEVTHDRVKFRWQDFEGNFRIDLISAQQNYAILTWQVSEAVLGSGFDYKTNGAGSFDNLLPLYNYSIRATGSDLVQTWNLPFTTKAAPSSPPAPAMSNFNVGTYNRNAGSVVITWDGPTTMWSDYAIVYWQPEVGANSRKVKRGNGGSFYAGSTGKLRTTLYGIAHNTAHNVNIQLTHVGTGVVEGWLEAAISPSALSDTPSQNPNMNIDFFQTQRLVAEEPAPPLKNLRLDRIDHDSVRVRWGGQDFRNQKGSYIYRIIALPADGNGATADRKVRRKRVTLNKLSANTLYNVEVWLVRERDGEVLKRLGKDFSTLPK